MSMWAVLALGAVETCINHLIDCDSVTRLQLNALHGKCLRVVIDAPNISLDMFFDDGKIRLEPTALGQAEKPSLFEQRPFDRQYSAQTADTTLHVADVVSLLKLLLASDEQPGNVPLQGDYQLLFQLKNIIAQADFDIAAQLTPWIGASLAHEIGKVQAIPKYLAKTAKSAEFMLTDTVKEDLALLAPRWQMDDLQQQTRQLRQNIDRLQAKVQHLQQQLQPTD